MREIGISPRFSRDKFVPLQTKQRYSTRDISSEVFLTLFFRGFVPFLSLADFVSRDKNLQVVDLQRLKSCFGELVTATTSMVCESDSQQEDATGIEDIDFCLELLHSDIINVAYILELIADLNPYSEDYEEKRKHIIDTMIKDAELRSKAKLIDGFIQKNVDDDRDNFIASKQKADGTSDLEERLNNYIVTERNNAVHTLAKEEDLDASVLNHYLSEYDYLQKEQPEIIQEALKEKHLGLIKKRKALTRILDKLHSIIRTFSWE